MKKISAKDLAWQLQTANARFSDLFRRSRAGAQPCVTKAGKEAAVVVPAEQFDKLIAKSHQPASLVEFFRTSPLLGAGLDFEREPDCGRDSEL